MTEPTKCNSIHDVQNMARSCIASVLDISPDVIGLDDDIVLKLGADSLDIIEIIMSCEEAMDIEVPDGEASLLTTLRLISDYIWNILSKRD